MNKRIKKCALILAGCGAKDGSEITESVSLMIALSKAGIDVSFFAPDRPFFHVINHLNNEIIESENRNMLVEAARIARGKISSLEKLNQNEFDILCFPGGFGVAKNFCNFAFAGKDAVLNEDIKKILFEFIHAKKIIGALCISPVLLALASRDLKLSQVKITVGSDGDVAKIIESWGIRHESKFVTEACLDFKNKFVTAPAYMDDNATSADIFSSATALVEGINTLLNQ